MIDHDWWEGEEDWEELEADPGPPTHLTIQGMFTPYLRKRRGEGYDVWFDDVTKRYIIEIHGRNRAGPVVAASCTISIQRVARNRDWIMQVAAIKDDYRIELDAIDAAIVMAGRLPPRTWGNFQVVMKLLEGHPLTKAWEADHQEGET